MEAFIFTKNTWVNHKHRYKKICLDSKGDEYIL